MTPQEEAEHKTRDKLAQRKLAYQLAAAQPAVQEMLQDLAGYCRAHVSAAPELEGPFDTNRTMILIGRQQVFDRISRHLHLTVEQLFALYTGKGFK